MRGHDCEINGKRAAVPAVDKDVNGVFQSGEFQCDSVTGFLKRLATDCPQYRAGRCAQAYCALSVDNKRLGNPPRPRRHHSPGTCMVQRARTDRVKSVALLSLQGLLGIPPRSGRLPKGRWGSTSLHVAYSRVGATARKASLVAPYRASSLGGGPLLARCTCRSPLPRCLGAGVRDLRRAPAPFPGC